MLDQIPTDTGAPAGPQRLSRAERRARDAEAKARREDILAAARQRRADRADEQKRRRKATRSVDRAAWWTTARARADQLWHTFVLVGAIVGVNAVAVAGQVAAFHQGLGWDLAPSLGAAAVIESIAIYVGWHAHVALIEGDSVFRLRAASYSIAALVAGLNYHHYAPAWKPTDKAIMFGLASLLSPWLWAMHSRHLHRKQLREAGLIDPRAPKFSALRWILHKDETWQALKWAVRHSEQSPAAAILAVQIDETTTEAVRLLDRTRAGLAAKHRAIVDIQRDTLAVADFVIAELQSRLADVSALPPGEETGGDDDADTSSTSLTDTSDVSDDDTDDRPDAQDNREAERWIRERMRAGKTPKQADIVARYGFSNGWASLRVKAARAALSAKGYQFLPGNVVKPPTEPPTEPVTVNGSQSAHADDVPMTTVEVS